MTNAEKFKTSEERSAAFRKFCSEIIKRNGCAKCPLHNPSCDKCEFVWLDFEYTQELKKCPLCGHSDVRAIRNSNGDVWYISCFSCGCRTGGAVVKDMAIDAWNRRDNND